MYTWTPNLVSCGNFSAALKINSCGVVSLPQRIVCPVKVRISIWPPFVNPPDSSGVDIKLINAIGEGLNLNITYTLSDDWSENFESSDVRNNFKALQLRAVDILITSLIPTRKRNEFFAISRYYHQASDGFCVPSSSKLPQYYKWLDVGNICAYSLTTLMIISIITHTLEPIRYTTVILNFFSVLTAQPLTAIPNTSSIRVILTAWLIFTLHMNILLQTKLISIMYKPLYTKQITTIDELLTSKLHLLFLGHYKRYFEHSGDVTARKVVQRMEDCDDIRICLKNVTVDKNSAVCIQYSSVDFYAERVKDGDGRPLLYCFKEPVNTSPLIMLMNRNFYLLDEVNKYIGYTTESGLVDKWVSEFFPDEHFYEELMTYQPLQLGNLRLVFWVYAVGTVAAIIVFIVETVW